MINYNNLFQKDTFGVTQKDKDKFFFKNLKKLNNHHKKNCKEFNLIANSFFFKKKQIKLEDLPFLHVNLFKDKNLNSVKKNTQLKIFNSSGTTGSSLSKVNIDRFTSLLQSRTLFNILMSVVGQKRDKIYFIDSENHIKKSYNTARGAAINGFKQIAQNSEFLLDNNLKINYKILKKINLQENIVFFSFTSTLWEKFLSELIDKKIYFNFDNSFLFHGGGWKKLENLNIEKKFLYRLIKKHLGIKRVYDYYGMIEQTGSIFLECEEGYYHASIFSEINIRNNNLEICKIGEKGIIQVSSLLPVSYPGHNILTEDLGVIIGEDNCRCGRSGKFFKIFGRLPQTELRGCSDV
tara:strand:- start:2600 stop:3649 length:1050 start_codon:yes stop_codon:yes gene_type:complete